MNTVEPLDESEGACTGGNFLARSHRVKQHGVILGMQMHRNRIRVQHSIIRRRAACRCEIQNPRISDLRHGPLSSHLN